MKPIYTLTTIAMVLAAYTASAQIPGNLGVTGTNNTKSNGASAGTSNTVTSGNTDSTRFGSTTAGGTDKTISSSINSRANDGNGRAAWDTENTYWKEHYSSRPYYSKSRDYNNYEPAYRYGVDLYNQNPGVPYSSLNQEQLRNGWNNARNKSQMDWSDVQIATQDAYNRLYESNTSTASPAR